MFFWEVKKFDPKQTGILGLDYFTDTGLPPKEGDRIYVATEIINRHQMAFHLAIEHTKQEIGRLYDGAVGQKVGVHNLVDVFKMDKDALGAAGIACSY